MDSSLSVLPALTQTDGPIKKGLFSLIARCDFKKISSVLKTDTKTFTECSGVDEKWKR